MKSRKERRKIKKGKKELELKIRAFAQRKT